MTSFLGDILTTIAKRGRALIDWGDGAPLTGEQAIELAETILADEGEASGIARAHTLLAGYAMMDGEQRNTFFSALATDFGPRFENIDTAIEAFRADPTAEHAAGLHLAAEPRRQELVRRLNQAPGGTAALVRMRTDLLRRIKSEPDLKAVDQDFSHLLGSWFNRGFLVLEEISWSTPASILEKIIQYEAVHEIGTWDDLRRRIEPIDRRCFAFFHPALVDEPLIFVEVALTRDIPDAIGPILSENRDPVPVGETTTAVFYSISNCQDGLKGVSFGNFLIKQVVEELLKEFPHLKTFVTLSPVPGFAQWLDGLRTDSESHLTDSERETLNTLEDTSWPEDPSKANALKAIMLPLAASYFIHAKHRTGKPLDPVARFHLGNGARLERLNWMADLSENGQRQAHGFMVNYLYDLKHIEKNHEAFANQGIVAAASTIRRSAKPLN